MSQVTYKGHWYDYTVTEKDGVKEFSLYRNGVLEHRINESDLDKRSVVSLLLDTYFRSERQDYEANMP